MNFSEVDWTTALLTGLLEGSLNTAKVSPEMTLDHLSSLFFGCHSGEWHSVSVRRSTNSHNKLFVEVLFDYNCSNHQSKINIF